MRRRVMASLGKPLPYMRRVAYLESHGTEWIDTGITPNRDMEFFITASYTSMVPGGAVYGARLGNGTINRFFAMATSTTTQGRVAYGKSEHSFNMSTNEEKEIIFNSLPTPEWPHGHYVFVNGTRLSVPSFLESSFRADNDNHMMLFAVSGYGETPSSLVKARVYSAGCRTVDGCVQCLIPVLDLSGRPAMYDEVSGQRFYNASGEGEFTWGELVA